MKTSGAALFNEEADAVRLLADLCLFMAQYFLQGPDERLDGLMGEAVWLNQLKKARLVPDNPGGEVANLPTHKREFEALLRIPSGSFVPPFEQAYHDRKATVQFSAPAACERVYGSSGYDLSPFTGVQPDHVGHQLRFLAALFDRLGKSTREGDSDAVMNILSWRSSFLRDRCWWWPRFGGDLLQKRPCRQIRVAATLLSNLGTALVPEKDP